jgi:hypothetical protein
VQALSPFLQARQPTRPGYELDGHKDLHSAGQYCPGVLQPPHALKQLQQQAGECLSNTLVTGGSSDMARATPHLLPMNTSTKPTAQLLQLAAETVASAA